MGAAKGRAEGGCAWLPGVLGRGLGWARDLADLALLRGDQKQDPPVRTQSDLYGSISEDRPLPGVEEPGEGSGTASLAAGTDVGLDALAGFKFCAAPIHQVAELQDFRSTFLTLSITDLHSSCNSAPSTCRARVRGCVGHCGSSGERSPT